MDITQRKIIHIDMDAFYASVEIRDQPKYAYKPVIVGGLPNTRSVVSTCNYIARSYGVHSGMSSNLAHKLCPLGVFLKPQFEKYKKVSQQIFDIFSKFTPLVEMIALDEAYLDVSASQHFKGSAILLAQAIQKEIFEATKLTASAGISYNKFLAKLASDINKPNGFAVILPNEGEAFIQKLAIGKFHGIGKSTEQKMHSLGIFTGSDLAQLTKDQLIEHFQKRGEWFYNIARGIDLRPVQADRIRKSIGNETTFLHDLHDTNTVEQEISALAQDICHKLQLQNIEAKTLTLKVKYANFEQITRSLTIPYGFKYFAEIEAYLPLLLNKTECQKRDVRLLGVSASNFINEGDDFIQLPLFKNEK